MPKNTAPPASEEMVSDGSDVFSRIYTPPEAFGLRRSQKTTVYVVFLHNFHAYCAQRAHESRYSYECAWHLAPVCRGRKRARAMRAPWSWGAFEK